MLVWLTLPFYDFCGFRSVAVNSVYKLQFFLHFYYYYPAACLLFVALYGPQFVRGIVSVCVCACVQVTALY